MDTKKSGRTKKSHSQKENPIITFFNDSIIGAFILLLLFFLLSLFVYWLLFASGDDNNSTSLPCAGVDCIEGGGVRHPLDQ